MKNRLFIYGASGHGKVIAEIVENHELEIEGFIDLDISKTSILGHPVVHEVPDKLINVIIAIGNNRIRQKLVNNNINFKYPCLIHRATNISKRVIIGEGTVIMAGATVNVDANIGTHCIINTNSSVDHDCLIGDFVHISPNVSLAGNVTVGDGTHVGIGTCVIQGVNIGKWCTIGAGSVIIRDVPDGCTVVGNPGKVIKIS